MKSYSFSNSIEFVSDPNQYSALLAYMGGTLDKCWDLSRGRYVQWGFRDQVLAANILHASVESLILKNNELPLLQQIVTVRFSCLKYLVLDGNNIESIESLAYLYAPELLSLSLKNNNIIDVSSLRNCHFPKLQEISVKQNHIQQLGRVQEWHFPELAEISLSSALYEDLQSQSLINLFKLQTKQLLWLFIVSFQRINPPIEMLERKYTKCCIKANTGGNNRRDGQVNNQHYNW